MKPANSNPRYLFYHQGHPRGITSRALVVLHAGYKGDMSCRRTSLAAVTLRPQCGASCAFSTKPSFLLLRADPFYGSPSTNGSTGVVSRLRSPRTSSNVSTRHLSANPCPQTAVYDPSSLTEERQLDCSSPKRVTPGSSPNLDLGTQDRSLLGISALWSVQSLPLLWSIVAAYVVWHAHLLHARGHVLEVWPLRRSRRDDHLRRIAHRVASLDVGYIRRRLMYLPRRVPG